MESVIKIKLQKYFKKNPTKDEQPRKISLDYYDFFSDMPDYKQEDRFGEILVKLMSNYNYRCTTVYERFPALYCFE